MSGELTLTDCLIIHLERSVERKPQVKKLKKDLPFQTKVVEAVDGSNPDIDFSKSYTPRLLRPRYPFSLRSAEVACFQSHRKCWQEILDRGLDAALIIEDDVDITDGEFTAEQLAQTNDHRGIMVKWRDEKNYLGRHSRTREPTKRPLHLDAPSVLLPVQ